MNKSPSLHIISEKLRAFGRDMGGVFTFADLWNILGESSSYRTAQALRPLLREGFLTKVRRNLYVEANPNLWVLASKIKKNAYVSMDALLAQNGLIGTTPAHSVSLVYSGNPQTLETPFGRIRFFKIQRTLFFGTQKLKNGVVVADNEKAFLDLLYYHLKGARFVIDPKTDVDLWKLKKKKLAAYLQKYKNPKFRKFVEGILHASK